ncbi:MAG: DUF4276 family protein [Acidobacteria bacterium]|nr:DUF4276 family protein [Acidobacteriota bacterium]
MALWFGLVVEGKGEREAIPLLIRRILSENDPPIYVQKCDPVRVTRSRLVREGGVERAVELALIKIEFQGPVLILIDADDDCPAETGPQLAARAGAVSRGSPVAVVLAKKEFEAWLLAGAGSLRGKRGLPDDLLEPGDPESIRGAKEWLTRHMPRGRAYSPTVDQAALTHALDLTQARRAPSFRRCCREVVRIAEAWLQATPHNS